MKLKIMTVLLCLLVIPSLAFAQKAMLGADDHAAYVLDYKWSQVKDNTVMMLIRVLDCNDSENDDIHYNSYAIVTNDQLTKWVIVKVDHTGRTSGTDVPPDTIPFDILQKAVQLLKDR